MLLSHKLQSDFHEVKFYYILMRNYDNLIHSLKYIEVKIVLVQLYTHVHDPSCSSFIVGEGVVGDNVGEDVIGNDVG